MTCAGDASTKLDTAESATLREVIVCSPEGWDDVWRRKKLLTDALLHRNPGLRVLFVEPPTDWLFDVSRLRAPKRPRSLDVRRDGRLHAFRPLKPLPRRLGPFSDRWLCYRLVRESRRIGFTHPILWLNDVTYAPLIKATDWPTVYDVTDDWLLAPNSSREAARLRDLDRLALCDANEVVVVSPALAASRGKSREVTVIPNGVDVAHFQRPRPRPADLPSSATAVYVGTLHDSRLDVDLLTKLAQAQRSVSVVLRRPRCTEPRVSAGTRC